MLISTATLSGRADTPTAVRLWRPISPKASTSRSDAPFNSGYFFQRPHRLHNNGQTIQNSGARSGLTFFHRQLLPYFAKVFVVPVHGNAAGEVKQVARAYALHIGAYGSGSIVNGVTKVGKSLTYFIHIEHLTEVELKGYTGNSCISRCLS